MPKLQSQDSLHLITNSSLLLSDPLSDLFHEMNPIDLSDRLEERDISQKKDISLSMRDMKNNFSYSASRARERYKTKKRPFRVKHASKTRLRQVSRKSVNQPRKSLLWRIWRWVKKIAGGQL